MITYSKESFLADEFNFFSCAEATWEHIHKHDFYEFAYVYEGTGKHCTEDGVINIKIGDFVLISPGYKHCVMSDNNRNKIRICNCLFEKNFFENSINRVFNEKKMHHNELFKLFNSGRPFCLTLSDNSDETLLNLVNLAKKEYDLEEYCNAAAIKRYLDIILLETSRTLDHHLGIANKLIRRRDDIDELIQYIKANLDMKLTVDFLAEQIHLSPDYLSKYFKKHTGKTLSQFLMETRINKAKQLLKKTDESIADIGYACGYSSSSNFRKYFTRLVGLSPREYRKSIDAKNFS